MLFLSLKTYTIKAISWIDLVGSDIKNNAEIYKYDHPTEYGNTNIINTVYQLAYLAYQVNILEANTYDSVYFLRNNLNLSQYEWVPIGTESNPFKGVFNGGGKAIANIKIKTARNYNGFFSFLSLL